LQVFDTVFMTKRDTSLRITTFELSGLFSTGLFYLTKTYNNFKNFIILSFLVLGGFLYFKDFFLFLTLYV
jgi:hypothetical protein